MAQVATKTRLETSKPRSLSISDTSMLQPAMGSFRLESDRSEKRDDGIHIQEMSGVFLKRIPLVEADFNSNSTIPSYQYHLENTRTYDVRVVMSFLGDNVKVTPANSSFSSPTRSSVEGVVERGRSTVFALLDAADKSKDFTFSADVKIYPVQDDVRETDLEGVKLFTTVAYSGTTTNLRFEAKNTKSFDVEVELDLKGDISYATGTIPFKRILRVGEKAEIGRVQSDSEVESSWKWLGLPTSTPNSSNSHIQTSELKGVTLKQTITSGTPSQIQFDVINSRDKRVRVEVDLTGDGEIDFRGQSRPLTGTVHPGQTTFIGIVLLRGDAEVNWKFKEELD